jgi:ABC-2 type transport system permease protein
VQDHSPRMTMNRSDLVTYYVLLTLTSLVTSVWMAGFIAEAIRLGGLSPWLLRPVPYVWAMAANNIGEKIIKLPLLVPLVLGMAVVFRHDIRLPTAPHLWLLFALSLPFAATISFLLDYAVGLLAFWLQDIRGLARTKLLIGSFLAGQFVPLTLFPPALHGILVAQPFRYTLSFPLEILSGKLSAAALVQGFSWQFGFFVALLGITALQWRMGLKAYGAAGA